MKKMNNMWGGEYVAPALEELNVTVECGFAASNPWEQSLDDETNWGSASSEFE